MMKKVDNLKILKTLVGIHSAFPNEVALSQFLANHLTELGFKVSVIMTEGSRPNIIATNIPAMNYLAFYGHMDTVGADPRYEANPLNVWVDSEGKLHGLGVSDMKGGITAILAVAAYAQDTKIPVKIVFGVDEENDSQGAHDLVASGSLGDVDFLISAESGQVQNKNQPYSICYGRRGRIALDVVITGRKVHAAEHSKGINAIEDASRFITGCSKLSFPKDSHFGVTSVVVHQISGSTDSFSVPDMCELRLSVLTTPSVKHQDVLNSLRKLAQTLDISANITPHKRLTPYAESYQVDPADPILVKLHDDIFAPDKVIPIYTASVADENIFATKLGITVISMGPVGGGDHTVDEWVSIQSVNIVAQAYTRVLDLYGSR